MSKISAVIVVKDNPPHIYETIDSVKKLTNLIFIIDIGIDHQLKTKLSQDPIFRIIEYHNPVPYVELIREQTKKNVNTDYLLFVDPDEVFPQNLIELIKKNLGGYDYFSIPRKNIIFNRWIQYSRWWPDYQIRVFKKDKVIWPTEIHKQPKASGKEFKVEPKEELAVLHYNYDDLDEFFSKLIRYAKSEAQIYIDKKSELNFTQTIKKALSEFISRYFAESGYKDGFHGFTLAFLQMFYCFVVYFYYWEKKKYFPPEPSELNQAPRSFFLTGLKETNYWLIKKNLVHNLRAVKLKIQSLFLKLTK